MNPILYLLLFILTFPSCTKNNYSHKREYQFKNDSPEPDYNSLDYWAAHPWKKDLSDSLPKALQESFQQDSLADVFFIHPTTLTSLKNKNWNAEINDATINAKTDYSTILYQASVFNDKCRVFAPRYRQAHIKAFYKHSVEAEAAFEIAYADVRLAFEIYLEKYNTNRPIIIASHSQGTKHASRILKEFFENKPLQQQLVCAYIIGMPVSTGYFTDIKPCTDSLATGCFVAWRTFRSNSILSELIASENFKSVVINPLTWTDKTSFAAASLNKGGVLTNFKKVVPKVTDAQIHNNVLWSSKPNVPGKIFFTRKNYHVGDINLFYMNIRENAAVRINSFLKNQK